MMTQRQDLPRLINGFFNSYLPQLRGASPNTIKAYHDSFKLLISFVSKRYKIACENLSIEQLDRRKVVAFLDYLEDQKRSVSTRNARLAAVRSFFKYVAYEAPSLLEQCVRIRSIPFKKAPQPIIQYFDENEMSALLHSIDQSTLLGVRDYALVLLLYNTGARAQEAVDLQLDHLRLDKSAQILIHGKGGKERICPLWDESVTAIKSYLALRDSNESSEYLFLNARGKPITRFGIRYIVRKHSAIASVKEKSIKKKSNGPHQIRHTTAMHMLKAGNDINLISMWLGHSDISTTHCYVELDIDMKRKMLEKRRLNLPGKKRKSKSKWSKESVLNWLDSLIKPSKLCAVVS